MALSGSHLRGDDNATYGADDEHEDRRVDGQLLDLRADVHAAAPALVRPRRGQCRPRTHRHPPRLALLDSLCKGRIKGGSLFFSKRNVMRAQIVYTCTMYHIYYVFKRIEVISHSLLLI